MVIASLGLIGLVKAQADAVPSQLTDAERSQYLQVLEHGLKDQALTVRVHAAEALIALHRPEPALKAFEPQRNTTVPKERILIWRVLARAARDPAQQLQYVAKIRSALDDPNGPDQTHAIEALAKLNEPIANDPERQTVRAIAASGEPAAPFALWRLAQAGDQAAVPRLTTLLASDDQATRFRTIYALGRLSPKLAAAHEALLAAAKKEPAGSAAQSMLRVVTGEGAGVAADQTLPPADRYFAAMFLADSFQPTDIPVLKRLIDDSNSDVRVAAAYALLKIDAPRAATQPALK
ncbi:MAG TPA: hypothetical protein VL282_04110 [Tepidisphaeraceae bacterium]|nr:hypothetical protein [Tepidisphaeraceae bacterium]